MREICPVCKKVVNVSVHGVVYAHSDKALNPCPMSGNSMGRVA